MVQHARVGRGAAHRARGAVVIAGEARVGWIMGGEAVMIGRRISVDHGGGGGGGCGGGGRIRMVMATRVSRRILTRGGRHVSVDVGGEISVMMARYSFTGGDVGMVDGRWPVMMAPRNARAFRVMMMSVLPLTVLLKPHQPVPDHVQIRAASKVVGMLVHVSVRVPVEVAVDGVALGRGSLVMMLVRVQNLLNARLQLVFARGGGRFLRQRDTTVILELLVQIFRLGEKSRAGGLEQRAGWAAWLAVVVLQVVAGFLNSSRCLERQVSREVQVPRAARKIVTVSRQNRPLTLHRSHVRLMFQHVRVPATLQIHLLPFLLMMMMVVMGQRALQPSYRLESALKRLQTPREFLAVGNSCTSHAPLPLRSHGIHAAHRRALARVLRIFRNVQIRGQLRLGHRNT